MKAIEKIKASKKAKKRKGKGRGGSDDDDDYNDLAQALYQKSTPLPGQMDNCAICEKASHRHTLFTFWS